ncbi:coiled-coil domain-containing protein 106-like [Brachionichthys hirsutus]|uniref:coiled-coil domain-containing protein 106-like n=1 Tax=Brachionichthys hirsutus TaxID=412623 RepID=UPI003604F965
MQLRHRDYREDRRYGSAAGGQSELEGLQALLLAERGRNQQMAEIVSGLKQDKELLQHEITKKAELICDFLQDKLQPEKRLHRFSNQMEPGGSQAASPEDVAGFDSPTMFDSFEEMELHPPEHHRPPRSKRSRDGESPRVRMKNVVGVIARYVAALKEFRRSVSMKVAFDRVGVDRNTISRTAAIAELSMAAPELFQALAPWNEKEETLAHYAHRCRQAMDDSIKAKIKTMKAKGELLPIVSK